MFPDSVFSGSFSLYLGIRICQLVSERRKEQSPGRRLFISIAFNFAINIPLYFLVLVKLIGCTATTTFFNFR